MKYQILFSAFILLNFISQSCAQNLSIDSLHQIIDEAPSDTARLKSYFKILKEIKYNHPKESCLLAKNYYQESVKQKRYVDAGKAATEVGTAYYYLDQLDSCLFYFNVAYQEHQKGKNNEGISVSLANLGNVFIQFGKYEKALEKLRESLAIDIMRNDSVKIVQGYMNIGLVYDYQTDFDTALIYYYQALDIGETLRNDILILETLNNLGVVHLSLKDYEKAMTSFKRSLLLSKKLNRQQYISSAYNNIGLIYDYKNQNDSALYYAFKALAIDTMLGMQRNIAGKYHNIAVIYEKEKAYSKAERYYLKSLRIKEEIGNPEKITSTTVNLGHLYILMDQPALAEEYLKRTLEIVKKYGILNWERESYAALAELYEKEGDYKRALENIKLLKNADDSILNQEKIQITKELDVKYETAVKQRKIAKQELEIEKGARKHTQLLAGIIGLAMSGIILLLLFVNIRQQKRVALNEKQQAENNLLLLKKSNSKLLQDIMEMEDKLKTPEYFAEQKLTLTTGGISEVKLKNVLYIQALGNGTQIFTTTGKHLEWQNLKAIKEILPTELFLQIHKSYIVNTLNIKKRTKRTMTMSNQQTINVGATFRGQVDTFFDLNGSVI